MAAGHGRLSLGKGLWQLAVRQGPQLWELDSALGSWARASGRG